MMPGCRSSSRSRLGPDLGLMRLLVSLFSHSAPREIFEPVYRLRSDLSPVAFFVTVSLGGVGTIEHVVNDTGETANTANQVVDLVSYP